MEQLFAFGEWVRRRRKALDLTQMQLARCAGCAAITIRRIEADSLRPSRQIAERLADCLTIPEQEREAFLRVARAERAVDRLASPLAEIQTAPPPPQRSTNLPYLLTSFIGRTQELSELTVLLTAKRLITVTGIGGTGKSRLALQAASQVRAAFPDGVWLVELAPLREASFVVQAVASVLSVREQIGQPLLDTLSGSLHAKQLLLILDNCEHLAATCAELIDALLQSCPQLHILATSHEPLNLLGEQLYPLAPLALPDEQAASLPDELIEVESVALFCERARMAKPHFVLTAVNAPLVAEICQRLDGLPLAIELAAVQIRRFSVQHLRDRLREPLALLIDGPRNLPQRQQTLRTTIDWSYQLLDPSEQQLFASLGVFSGGWTIEAVQAIGRDAIAPDLTTATALAALLDKSLVRLMQSADDQPRFVMLETLQFYARERLAADGQLERRRQQHAEYYVELVEQAEQALAGAQASLWLGRFDQEHENLRTALAWTLAQVAHSDLALRLCAVLWRFWWMRGYLHEGRHWLNAALAAPGQAPLALRAKVLRGAGVLARVQGDLAAATTLLGEALALSNALDDPLGIALAVNSLGVLYFNQSDYERAKTFFAESLRLYQALDDPRRVAIALNNLGNIAYKEGAFARAAELYESGLVLLTDAADQQTTALITTNLGDVARVRKDYQQASRLLITGATLYRELNDMDGLLLCLNNLAEIAIDQQQSAHAARLLGAMEALYERLGAVRSPDLARDYERQVTTVHRQLRPSVFAAAWREGRALTIDQLFSLTIAPAP